MVIFFIRGLSSATVGSIGSQAGWSSVITRSKKGEEIFHGAVDAGLIEFQNLKDVKPGLGLLERIAATKRKNCKPIELKKEKERSDNHN